MKSPKRVAVVITVFMVLSFFCTALCGCEFTDCFGKKKSANIQPHLISEEQAEENPVRPIDSVQFTRGFESDNFYDQLDELVSMVYKGDGGSSKPDFSGALDGVEKIYNEARKILDRFILNDFSDYERVHAIHDYLAYYIEYDLELLESTGGETTEDNPAFGLDGVFLNKKAVCDGFTKAFLLMCGIEQVRCIRVTGQYNFNGTDINHSWNKVYLAGEAAWYNVDATMDSWHVLTDSDRLDVMNHGYFLVSDNAIKGTLTGRHTESKNDPVTYECKKDYPFHKLTSLGIGSYSMEITNQTQLNDIFVLIKKSKRKIGKVELKLNFDDYDAENLKRADAYVPQITEAYNKVKDRDFTFNANAGVYPYQRYPNGVFVFLIYK